MCPFACLQDFSHWVRVPIMSIRDWYMVMRVRKALRNMVVNTLLIQQDNADAARYLCKTEWLRRYATVRLAGPRGCGHTYATRVLPRLFDK